MLFSCKISHSILTYLDRQGADLSALFEACEYPSEFLRNPSHWLEADKMEELLTFFRRDFNRYSRDGDLISEAGHTCKDLRSWGVLDSVLRMMQAPKDIYAQPDRFMSYFVSPAPPVGNVNREPNCIFFEIPISATQYPLVTNYLRSALEALPTYVGRPLATVEWNEIRLSIDWSENQESFFGGEVSVPSHLSPDVVRGVMATLEATTKQLDDAKAQLAERDRELQLMKTKATSAPSDDDNAEPQWLALANGMRAEVSQPAQEVLSHIYRLNDYMTRAHQLVTLLINQGRNTPQVQEAMRRVDWTIIQAETPGVVNQAALGVRKIQEIVQDLAMLANADKTAVAVPHKVSTNLNSLVAKAVESIQGLASSRVKLDQHLLLDRDVKCEPKPLEKALMNIVKNAVQSIDGDGSVRIVTRPSGTRAEIEISDTGVGMSEKVLSRATEPFFTTQAPGKAAGLGLTLAHAIVRDHDGSMSLKSQPGHGTTVVISLPL